MNIDGVDEFTPSRLALARERRGVTQRLLSQMAGVSDRMIKAYESGSNIPSAETLQTISRVLKFPVSFFTAAPIDGFKLDAASFRALTKAGASLRNRALAAGTIAMELHRFISDRFVLPSPDVPDLRDQTPARAAEAVRQLWGLGQRSIPNVVHMLELHGVRVFSLSEDCDSIDAFSVWRDGTPFVFLNTRKTSERSIFDAAHELGHLVLHQHGSPQGQGAESAADKFAASFLLPEDAIRATAPRLATIATVTAMKKTWRASVAALGFRLHELGLMSEWHYRRFNIELSRRGRKNEPAPLPRESSAVLQKALKTLAEEGLDLRVIAKELHVPVGEIRALSFGMLALDGEGGGGGDRTGRLSLVES